MLDIIGVGDTDVDLTIRLDHIPARDEKVRGSLVGKDAGGIICNFCCAAARLGKQVGVASVVGDDEYGAIARSAYEKFGVETTGLITKPGKSTYFCVIHIDASGEKALTLVESELVVPAPGDLDLSFLEQARFIHLTSLSHDLAEYVAGQERLSEVKMSIDIEEHQDPKGIENWRTIIRRMSVVFLNEAGLRTLFGDDNLSEGARKLLALGAGKVVVTQGEKGCQVFSPEEEFSLPAFSVPVVDTTGAGDCFNAAFLASLADGMGLGEAALRSTAAAALSIQRVGARGALPTGREIEAFLSQRPATKQP